MCTCGAGVRSLDVAPSPLSAFTPAVRDWFERAFEGPTPAQAQAWPAIATGEHVLITRPDRVSGKTLAAFLWALDRLAPRAGRPHAAGLRLAAEGARLRHRPQPARAAARHRRRPHRRRPHRRHARSASARRCAAPARHPHHDARVAVPDAHLAGAARCSRGVEAVIIDEIHAVAATKRGAHLALTLERLAALKRRPRARSASASARRRTRSRRSAASWSARAGRATIVDAGVRKPLDLKIHVPVESMVEPRAGHRERPTRSSRSSGRRGDAPARSGPRSTPSCCELVREHRSTIVFVNSRRGAERLALRLNELANADRRRPHATSPAPTTARSRARSASSSRRCSRPASCRASSPPRRSSSASTWAPSTSCCRSSRRSRSRAGCSASAAPATASATRRKGRIFPKFRADLLECAVVVQAHARGPDRADRRAAQRARRARPADRRDRRVAPSDERGRASTTLYALVTRTHSYAELPRELLENVLDMLDGRYPSQEFGELRPRIVWDRVAGTIRARKGARQLAVTNAGTIPDRGLFSVVAARRPPRRRARRGDGLRGARRPDVPARRVVVAHRGDRPRPRDRHARAGRARAPCRSGRATASGARRSSARRSARSAAGPSTRTPRRSSATTTSTRSPRRTSSTSCASSRRRRASCRATARSSSSASATRSATGGCACCRPYGGRVHAAWGLALSAPDPRAATASSPTRSGPTTGSSSTSPTPTSRPARTSSCSSPTRSRTPSSPSWRRARCSARASARTPAARC